MKDLTKEQIKELNRLTVQIVDEASIVKMDYEDNPSNLDSGSIIVVHQNSSLLNNKQEKLSDVGYNIVKKNKTNKEEKMKKTNFNTLVGDAVSELNVINSEQLNEMMKSEEDIIILDVNDKEDVEQRGMIDGAVNISLGTLYYKADDTVPDDFKDDRIQDRSKKVVMTCGLGLCAAIGGKLLQDMGFEDVHLLEGGVTKWTEDGYELHKS